MKKIFAILICLVLFSSCSIDWNWEKDKKIAELEKKLEDKFFDKKKECLSYKEEILKQLNETASIYQNRNYTHTESLKEIFYSPTLNSCVYTTFVKENQDWVECEFFKSYDYLSVNNDLWIYLEFKDWKECDFTASWKKYDADIKELKWE